VSLAAARAHPRRPIRPADAHGQQGIAKVSGRFHVGEDRSEQWGCQAGRGEGFCGRCAVMCRSGIRDRGAADSGAGGRDARRPRPDMGSLMCVINAVVGTSEAGPDCVLGLQVRHPALTAAARRPLSLLADAKSRKTVV